MAVRDPNHGAASARALRASLRKDPAVAEIIRSWRELTGGGATKDAERRTLVACSGGADSAALALALAAAAPGAVALGHIVHDLRPLEQALADRDAVRALAARLGIGFVEGVVQVRGEKGNPEALARHARYRALGGLAVGFPFLATAHHGDDQLETILMRLVRGAGPRGLAGIRASRLLPGFPVRVIRPMLGVTRADGERICRTAGLSWREDATNQDTTRLRAALRAGVIPELRRLAPRVAQRARASAELLGDASELIDGQAGALLAKAAATATSYAWPRAALLAEPRLILATTLRLAAAKLAAGSGLDRLSWRVVKPAVDAVLDGSTQPRVFQWKNVEVRIDARAVLVSVKV